MLVQKVLGAVPQSSGVEPGQLQVALAQLSPVGQTVPQPPQLLVSWVRLAQYGAPPSG